MAAIVDDHGLWLWQLIETWRLLGQRQPLRLDELLCVLRGAVGVLCVLLVLLLLEEDGVAHLRGQILLRGWCGLVVRLWCWWWSRWAILLQQQWLLMPERRSWLWLRQLLLHDLLRCWWCRQGGHIVTSYGWWWWWWWSTQRNLMGSRGDVGRGLLCWLHTKLIQVLHGGSDGLEQASGYGGTIGNGFVGLSGAMLREGLWVTHSGWTVLHIDIGMGLRV